MFQGVGVALITPFQKDLNVDYAALERLIHHVSEGGVDFLVALGTTAETPTLSKEEKKSVLKFILEKNTGNLPVVVGLGGNNTREVIDSMSDYPLEQVAGLLSVAPYYNRPSQKGIYEHYKAIADATSKEIILYNVPGRTASNILPETVVRLAEDCSNVVAIKEASGNLDQCMELVARTRDDFSVLSGDDHLILAQMALGMRGVISVAANSYPKMFTRLVQTAGAGNLEEARALLYRLLPAIRLLFAEGNPTGVKFAASLKGLCDNYLRLPLVAASEELREAFGKLPGLE